MTNKRQKLNDWRHLGIAQGLQALTSDISKLVGLRVLTLDIYDALGYKPESLSGLQKLEHLTLRQRRSVGVRPGLSDLARVQMAMQNASSTAPSLYDASCTAPSLYDGCRAAPSLQVAH